MAALEANIGNETELPLPTMAFFLHPSIRTRTRTSSKTEIRAELEMETRPSEDHYCEEKGNGINLTWKDLSVTVADGKKTKSILHGLTGFAKSGQLLAIMGPSGCGKSTLLDALAGRLGSNTNQTGDILINGRKQSLVYGTSAYVTQDDTLMTTLTVEETLYYSAQLQLPDSMSNSDKKERANMTIREMGLQDAINTRIGGWGVKGLSGGQKRRVSICIEILTRPKLLFLDEPTSGLDGAASYYVMRRIASLDQGDNVGRTIICSIHQPSSEIFQLFNNLCLLSAGKIIYFGPAAATNEFFALNGFPCPALQNPSDHFLKNINKDFEQDIEQGLAGKIPTEEVINILINSYKSSGDHQHVQRQIDEICNQDWEAIEKTRQASFLTQCIVLTKRSFINMYRDPGYYWLRFAIYIGLGLGLATVFYDIEISYGSIRDRGSLIMFAATYLTFMAIGGFPSFVEEMKVFERERLNGHYSVSGYVIGNTLSSIPYLLLISLIPGALIYILPGLHQGFEHFIYYVLVLFACMLLVESLMLIVASLVPNFLMGIITGAGIQGLMMLGGGFFRLPNDLPGPFWRYPLYFISFHKYAFQGLFKNEFAGTVFTDSEPGKIINGEEILSEVFQVEVGYSKWTDVAILMGMVVLYRVLFWVIIKSNEKVMPFVSSVMSRSPKQTRQIMSDMSATCTPSRAN